MTRSWVWGRRAVSQHPPGLREGRCREGGLAHRMSLWRLQLGPPHSRGPDSPAPSALAYTVHILPPSGCFFRLFPLVSLVKRKVTPPFLQVSSVDSPVLCGAPLPPPMLPSCCNHLPLPRPLILKVGNASVEHPSSLSPASLEIRVSPLLPQIHPSKSSVNWHKFN